MCGRYVLVSSQETLVERFGVDEVRTDALPPRYNVAPSVDVYAVVDHDARRRLGALRWGFIPRWARALRGTPQPINARIETLATARMFADAARRRRCLIPADGFYEWLQRGEGRPKQPFHVAPHDHRPMAFAGVWSLWRDPAVDDAEPLASAAIVTTEARDGLAGIHPRMPVILPEELWTDWLRGDPDETPALLDRLRTLPPPPLDIVAVSNRVNAVRNDGPDLLVPVDG